MKSKKVFYDQVTARAAKAGLAFGRLRGNVWERKSIRLNTQLKFYKTVVLPNLIHCICMCYLDSIPMSYQG